VSGATGNGAGSGAGSLSATGGELPWGAALAAAVLLTAGGLFMALRRRRTP
jgi:endo-1,4-beta-xylanase